MDEYGKQIAPILDSASTACRTFIVDELRSSLASIGFSRTLVGELAKNLGDLNVGEFHKKYSAELGRVYTEGFFQNIVPRYFQSNVLPQIPEVTSVLDIGCGTGILAHVIERSNKVEQVIGIDIAEYPEWDKFRSQKVEFKIMPERELMGYLQQIRPDVVTITWALHHMAREEQMRYLHMVSRNLVTGAILILLEDCYAEGLRPENGQDEARKFFAWSIEERAIIMSVYDWLANRVLAQRLHEPIPFTFRTLEEWVRVCERVGLKIIHKHFIGFPKERDINTPQSLLVLQKE